MQRRLSMRLLLLLVAVLPAFADETKSLADLRQELLLGDLKARQKAAYAFWQMGQEARASIPVLAQAMRDADGYVRSTVGKVLERFDWTRAPDALAAGVPYFLEALYDERAEVRREAARMLWRTGPLPEPLPQGMLPKMMDALADKDAIVRATLCSTFVNLGAGARAALPALVEAARDEDGQVRSWALQALAAIDAAGNVETFQKALEDADGSVRAAAANALALQDERARPAIPRLIEALKDKEGSVRQGAANALSAIGAPEALEPLAVLLMEDADPAAKSAAAGGIGVIGGARAVEALSAALKSEDPAARSAAVNGAAFLGPEGAPLVPLLAKAMDLPELRAPVCGVLGSFGKAARAAEPALIGALSDLDETTRLTAAATFSSWRWASAEGILALCKALSDSSESVRGYAAQALAAIADPSALSSLVVCYRTHTDDKTREAAIFAITALGPAAGKALPFLIEVRDEGKGLLKLRASLAVARVAGPGPECEAAVALALESLAAPELRPQALSNLGELGPAAKAAAPRLREMLSSGDWRESMPAAAALLRIEGGAAKDALEHLLKPLGEGSFYAITLLGDSNCPEAAAPLRAALASKEAATRAPCAASLGRIRPAAPETLQALQALLKDRHWSVRAAAARALETLS